MIKVKVVNKSSNQLPGYATELSAGMDLRASISEDIVLKPLERKLIGTGLFVEIPDGFEGQVRPRSGLALKSGLTVLNSPGTIDADYRGEIGIILINLSDSNVTIHNGDRIAQMVITKCEKVEWEGVEVLEETRRGEGGFGHTGGK